MPEQTFYACAYDIDSRVCCTIYTGGFSGGCYSYNRAVFSLHYLLRKNPYRIMWCGETIYTHAYRLKLCNDEDILLGISTAYHTYDGYEEDDFAMSTVNCAPEIYKFIDENYKTWKHISVWDKAKEYFNYNCTKSVKYEGFLVNHTKKQAVNLKDYFENSKFLMNNREVVIDLIPVLTETGGGTMNVLSDGIPSDSTEYLASYWCTDLLQIIEECPNDYEILDCCVSPFIGKTKYCYTKYGIDKDGYVFKNNNGDLFRVFSCSFFRKDYRNVEYFVKEIGRAHV